MLTVVSPAAFNDLVTVDRVKNELSITGTSLDAQLEDLIDEASSLIAAYCNRDSFGAEDLLQTERPTCPRACIVLGRDLAVTIGTVTEDGTTLADTDYEADGALLYRLYDDARVAWSANKVVIEYTAGFALPDDAPVALSRAALDLVVGMYRGIGRDTAIRSEQVEGVGQTAYFETKAGTIALSGDRVAALARYRLVSIG